MADSKSYPSPNSPSGKNVKAPNVFERAKEEFEAVIHSGKHRHEHHKETHGLRDDIDCNTPVSDVKAPNVFERAKEEIEAIVEAIHPKKDPKSHDSHISGETRTPAVKSEKPESHSDQQESQYYQNSADQQESQYYQNSQISQNLNQIPEQVQPSLIIPCNWFCNVPHLKGEKWTVKEDVALMSSWCSVSGDKVHGRNRKSPFTWKQVHNLYQEARASNPEVLRERNVDMIKGRWKRLNENGNKWVVAYKEAYGRKRSGMSLIDVEKEAHAIYEAGGSKFENLVVFNEVMSKHPKWDLTFKDSTQLCPETEEPNEESGASFKRSRTFEDEDYHVPSNIETPSIGCSTIPHPTGRDKVDEKGKYRAPESLSTNEVAAEIHEFRLTRDEDAEVMSQWNSARIELELKKEQRKAMKMNKVLLNTLLAKDHLSPEDKELKRRLVEIVFGQ